MWTIPHHGKSGGIEGLQYLYQVSWPVGLFVLSKFPNHLHYGFMWSLHQPISFRVVWHGLQFLNAEEHTQFVNDAAHKASTPFAQEPGWGPKDQDVTLIQELGNGFSCLIRGHIYHNVLCEVVLVHQDVGDSRQLVQLHGHLYAGKMYMQEVQGSIGHYWVQRCLRLITLMLQAMHAGFDGLLHLTNHSWPPEVFP